MKDIYHHLNAAGIEAIMIKILVVEDSALMRKYLRRILEDEFDFKVFTARNGQEALDMIKEIDPDVVTLDINMPVMDGLTCLSHIMTDSPRPVLMVSSLTEKGALATFEALELGAVDYISKPGGTVSMNVKDIAMELVQKVRAAARIRQGRVQRRLSRSLESRKPIKKERALNPISNPVGSAVTSLVLIGSSTGGPRTLEEILSSLPADFPYPVLVSQHMPATFTNIFAERLNKVCALEVQEVNKPTPLVPGKILVAKGDADVLIGRRDARRVALCVPSDNGFIWHPSVERMTRSAMEYFSPQELIAVLLTGMGHDGSIAMSEIYKQGGHTIAESEETAIVFGMPQELINRNGAEIILPYNKIAHKLIEWSHIKSGQLSTLHSYI